MTLAKSPMLAVALLSCLVTAHAAEDMRISPELNVPRSRDAVPGGDLAEVDWAQAGVLAFRAITGESCTRNMEARLLHDGDYLYVRVQDTGIDTDKLKSYWDVWSGDDWELFFAKQPGQPYRQIGVNPKGEHLGIEYPDNGDTEEWDTGATVISETTGDRWTVRLAVPLKNTVPDGCAPGDMLYMNFARTVSADGAGKDSQVFAWSPTFEGRLHIPGRFGKVLLEETAEKPFFEEMGTVFPKNCCPEIVLLEDGRLLLAGTCAMFSSDHGKTWSKPEKLPCGAGSTVVADGRIIIFGTKVIEGDDGIRTGADVISTTSTDAGKTWSEPKKHPMPHTYTLPALHPAIRLNDGTLFTAVTWDMVTERRGKSAGQVNSDYMIGPMVSRDEGDTWQILTELHAEYPDNPRAIGGTDEPSFVQLPDGQIYMLARTGAGCLYEASSLDEGKTWSKPKPTPIGVNDTPSAMFRLRTGEVVLVAQPSGLGKMCVWVSTDNCKSWIKRKHLVGEGAGWCGRMPSVTQAADGTIVAVFPQYATPQGTGGRRITGARFNRAWLLSTAEVTGR